jgi:hypothetical protein
MMTCRYCGKFGVDSSHFVKYGRRHYAHHRCYLGRHKNLNKLTPHQIGQFPWKLLREFDLFSSAEQRLNAVQQAA